MESFVTLKKALTVSSLMVGALFASFPAAQAGIIIQDRNLQGFGPQTNNTQSATGSDVSVSGQDSLQLYDYGDAFGNPLNGFAGFGNAALRSAFGVQANDTLDKVTWSFYGNDPNGGTQNALANALVPLYSIAIFVDASNSTGVGAISVKSQFKYTITPLGASFGNTLNSNGDNSGTSPDGTFPSGTGATTTTSPGGGCINDPTCDFVVTNNQDNTPSVSNTTTISGATLLGLLGGANGFNCTGDDCVLVTGGGNVTGSAGTSGLENQPNTQVNMDADPNDGNNCPTSQSGFCGWGFDAANIRLIYEFSPKAPVPATPLLLGVGLALLGFMRRRLA